MGADVVSVTNILLAMAGAAVGFAVCAVLVAHRRNDEFAEARRRDRGRDGGWGDLRFLLAASLMLVAVAVVLGVWA